MCTMTFSSISMGPWAHKAHGGPSVFLSTEALLVHVLRASRKEAAWWAVGAEGRVGSRGDEWGGWLE